MFRSRLLRLHDQVPTKDIVLRGHLICRCVHGTSFQKENTGKGHGASRPPWPFSGCASCWRLRRWAVAPAPILTTTVYHSMRHNVNRLEREIRREFHFV